MIVTFQICWVRPCTNASATTSTRPSLIEAMKFVLLLTPTAIMSRSMAAVDAPTLAEVSIADA